MANPERYTDYQRFLEEAIEALRESGAGDDLQRIVDAVNNQRRISKRDLSIIDQRVAQARAQSAGVYGELSEDAAGLAVVPDTSAREVATEGHIVRWVFEVADTMWRKGVPITSEVMVNILGNLLEFRSEADLLRDGLSTSEARAISDATRWGRTFPDHLLFEDRLFASAAAALDDDEISRDTYSEIGLTASAGEAASGEALRFVNNFVAGESEMMQWALDDHGDVGPFGADSPGDFDRSMSRRLDEEERLGIVFGSDQSLFPATRDQAAIQRAQAFERFAGETTPEKMADRLLAEAGIDPSGATYTDKFVQDALKATKERLAAQIELDIAAAETGERPGFTQQIVFDKARGKVESGAFVDEWAAEAARLEREAVSTEAGAEQAVKDWLFRHGSSADNISDEAMRLLAQEVAQGGTTRALEGDEGIIGTFERNKQALDDAGRVLRGLGVAGPPGSAFQTNLDKSVIPKLEQELADLQAQNPAFDLTRAADILLGETTPFEAGLRNRRQQEFGEERQTAGLGGFDPLTRGDVFEAFQESRRAGNEALGIGAFEVDPELFAMQFDESRPPTFQSDLTAALELIDEELAGLPAFMVERELEQDVDFAGIEDLEIQKLLRDLAGDDPDFLRFLIGEVGTAEFEQAFLDEGARLFGEGKKEIGERGFFLGPGGGPEGEGGGFTLEQEARFVREETDRLRKEVEGRTFGDFITAQAPTFTQKFQQTPAFMVSSENRRKRAELEAEKAELERQRDIEEVEFERRKRLRSTPRRAFT